jgi:hypothetical protein
MVIAVYTCERYRPIRVQAQLDTWIPKLQAKGYDVEIFDGPRLGVKDGYQYLSCKTRALIEWAHNHGHSSMLKIDDDGAINSKTFEPVSSEYAGIRIKANDYGNPAMGVPSYAQGTFPNDYASGGAYWLGQKAMEAVLDTQFIAEDFAEDRLVGHALAANGIKFTELENYGWSNPGSNWIVATQLYPKAMYKLYEEQ